MATGEISGTPVGGSSSDVTITLTGRGVTTTKVFKVQVVDMDAFAYKVDVNATGYSGSETLRDFPALIRLSVAGVNGFSYNGFLAKDLDGKSTGYDLRAFDANGRILPYEIENWDPEGVSEIWVRTYDLNSWQETPESREAIRDLPKDQLVVEGYGERPTFRKHIGSLGNQCPVPSGAWGSVDSGLFCVLGVKKDKLRG